LSGDVFGVYSRTEGDISDILPSTGDSSNSPVRFLFSLFKKKKQNRKKKKFTTKFFFPNQIHLRVHNSPKKQTKSALRPWIHVNTPAPCVMSGEVLTQSLCLKATQILDNLGIQTSL